MWGMSRPLVYLVAMSRHPLLMDDPTARDVLACMADKARDTNGGRIVGSLASFAEASERGYSAVRHARDRLIEAGLLVKTGAGDTSKRAESFYIDEEKLSAKSNEFTLNQTPRNQRGSATTHLPRSCREPAAELPRDRRGVAAELPPTRARVLNKEHGTENLEQSSSSAHAHATPEPTAPAEQPAAAAWGMWEAFITGNNGKVVEVERAIITDAVERFGLTHVQSAIASLVDAKKRPPVGWVHDRAGKAHAQAAQAGKPASVPTHRRAGLPTAADLAAAQVDEAAELARLETEAARERARIEAVAPRPTVAPVQAVAPEPVASPEKMRELADTMRGLFGGKR